MCFNHCHTHHAPAVKTTKISRRNILKSMTAGGAAVAASGLTACATNSATGRNQFTIFSPGEKQLSQLAATSWSELKRSTPTSNDPRYTGRLQSIGERISRSAGRDDEQWEYTVFDQNTLNAFVLPGNRVGFYKGMMDFVDNDDQLASIMGHEVGHVVGRHAQERYSTQVGSSIAVNTATAALGGVTGGASQVAVQALGLGAQFGVLLPYSRKHETESDKLGAIYAQQAGYDPYEGVKLWEKMAERNQTRQPEFMSTHPDPLNRAQELHDFIKVQEELGSQGFKSIKT